MKFFSHIFLVFALFCFSALKAQNTFPMISMGYTYQNQSFGEVGGKLAFTQAEKNNLIFRLGASAMMGSTNGKFAIMPKIQGDILFNPRKDESVYISHAFYYIAGVETTTKYFAPHIGLSVMSIVDFTLGYSFSYPNQTLHGKELKGVKFGIIVNIPIQVLQK